VTGVFKANNPINTFLLFVYGLCIKWPMFVRPLSPSKDDYDGFFYRYLIDWLYVPGQSYTFIYSIIAFLFLYIQAIELNNLVNRQKLLPKPNYLPGMCYLLITSLFGPWNQLSAQLVALTGVLWMISQLSQLYNHPQPRIKVFNIGFVLGLVALFYFPAISFLLLLMLGLAITRPFRLAEWIIGLIGVLAPVYFFGSWLFLTDRWQHLQWPEIGKSVQVFKDSIWLYLPMGLVLFGVMVGSFFIQANMRRLLVQSRKTWSLIYVAGILASLLPFIDRSMHLINWILPLGSVAAILSAALFYPQRRWFALLIHWGLLVLAWCNFFFLR
jgi:hypothetical protein